MAEGLDSSVLTSNAVTAGSHVTTTISKTKADNPMWGPKARTRNLRKRKMEDLLVPKRPKKSRTLIVPLQSKKGSSELTGSNPIDSVFRDLDPLLEQKSSKVVVACSPTHFQDSDFFVLPDQSSGQNVLHPSATLSGFFGGEGSSRPAPVEATRSLLSDLDHLDPSVALRWAMTGELTFGLARDFESFEKDDMTDQCQRSLHFLTMLLRKCDLAVKDREKLTRQVNRLVEEKTKLLADNAKLLASHGNALATEKKKNEESSHLVATLEKQRDSLNFHLRDKLRGGLDPLIDYSPDFEFGYEEFCDDEIQEKGDQEDDDQGEGEDEEEVPVEDFQGDIGGCNNDCNTTCYYNIEKQPPLCEIHWMPEHQQLIVDKGALLHLVNLLNRHKDGNGSRAVNSVIRRAADAIANLAHQNSSIKTCVRMEGGIPPLVELLEFTDTKVQRVAAGARDPWHLKTMKIRIW
ncbi:hypothetical protein LWI29_033508 [Acer saccharum]|uniref:Uncharacterized protein n=1 Tax=Acer saccharum TaxID=4024 RepID=A0AA39SGZ8_ACESA|nr:hypothetical protein LWI29_033508 [Acer saccharum]